MVVMSTYNLKKSNSILRLQWKLFRKRKNKLPKETAAKIKAVLTDLQESLLAKDRSNASEHAKNLENLSKIHLKRSLIHQLREGFFALLVALIIAVLIRQVAFELFEIPSGSMRPTFKEQDRLIVSKSQFGLNIPLTTSHFLFDNDAVKRMGVVIFTGQNMDIPNVKTRYFYLFPGYRQYIKRMIGKPGDSLYFYGGRLFGIDRDGNDITGELQNEELSHIEHIPFIHLEGKINPTKAPVKDLYSPITIKQMNLPMIKLYLSPKKEVHYDILMKPKFNERYKERSFDYHDFWGMGGYANARIIKRDVLTKSGSLPSGTPKAPYYLELSHHPSVKKIQVKRDPYYRIRPTLNHERSFVPLTDEHLEKIWDNIYTGRFIIKDGRMRRYGLSEKDVGDSRFLPKLKGAIPDGTYEFYQGVASEVMGQGISKQLLKDHPLAKYNVGHLLTIFNGGIECDIRFLPTNNDHSLPSARYAYFRDGDLYLMGAPILSKNDPNLQAFVEREIQLGDSNSTYTPFYDRGPPLLKSGELDKDLIRAYGIQVREKSYLVLGDNHAMSGDTRDFGFVPEDNIRGVPSLVFWGPNTRFGFSSDNPYQIVTTPRVLVWTFLSLGMFLYIRNTKRTRREILYSLLP